MNEKLTRVQVRARQYWFIDGLAEMGAGLVCLILAALYSLLQVFFTWRWSLPVLMLAALAAAISLRLLIQRIKEKSTYPRTGYIAPPTGTENRGLVAALVAFTILLLGLNAYLVITGNTAALWSPALDGLAFGFLLVWTGVLVHLRRLIVLGVFDALLGTALSLLAVPFFTSLAVLCAATGLILLVTGWTARRQYLSQQPSLDH